MSRPVSRSGAAEENSVINDRKKTTEQRAFERRPRQIIELTREPQLDEQCHANTQAAFEQKAWPERQFAPTKICLFTRHCSPMPGV